MHSVRMGHRIDCAIRRGEHTHACACRVSSQRDRSATTTAYFAGPTCAVTATRTVTPIAYAASATGTVTAVSYPLSEAKAHSPRWTSGASVFAIYHKMI
jgi:hypothetical protein